MVRRFRQQLDALPPADRVAWIGLAVAALAAVLLIATQDTGDSASTLRAPAATTPGETPAGGGGAPATVDQATPLLLGGTHVRVFRASLSGRIVTVTMRVRNRTERPQQVGANGQEFAFATADIVVRSRPLPGTRVAVATSETVRAQFELPDEAVVSLRTDPRGELHVVPWSEDGATGGRGVVRLGSIEGAGR